MGFDSILEDIYILITDVLDGFDLISGFGHIWVRMTPFAINIGHIVPEKQ